MQKCPIYNTIGACTVNSNCLFLRNGGCAVVLAPIIAEENKKKITALSQKMDNIQSITAATKYLNI